MEALVLLRESLDHMAWADARVWRTVLGTQGAGEDPAVRGQLLHTHMLQWAFLSMWTKVPFERERAASLSIDQLAEWAREFHSAAATFTGSIDPALVGSAVSLPWSKQVAGASGRDLAPTTLGETMMQIVLHSAQHRGQVNARLRELGGEPLGTDFISWVTSSKPSAEWPEACVE